MSYRNGLTVTDNLLLHHAYNPSASHPLSTSPYTGEASPVGDGGRKRACAACPRSGHRRRVPPSDFRQFICRKFMEFSGSPQNLFCGALFHVKHFPGLLPLRARRGKRSPAADAGLGCRRNHSLRERTGGSGGHFALGVMAPRRPFCPLSAGGKWTRAPQRSAAGPISPSTEGGKTSGGWRQRTKGADKKETAPQRRLRGKARKKTGELLEEGRKSKEGEKGA